ncbi:MAG: hypothetical protein ACYSUB_01620 [Planctomycetota bacterium]|jgi:hypothetical protein
MKNIRPKHGPEYIIQRDVMAFLRARGWWVERTHGNLFQKGFPDLYIAHHKFGQRWLDIKNPVSHTYTKAQCQKWPIWHQFGIGIWIIVAATEEEYDKLFKPPNWANYWKPRYDEYLMDVNVLLDELLCEEAQQLPTSDTVTTGRNVKTRTIKPVVPPQDTDTSWLDDLEKQNA